jgi:hypothetical protein
MSLEEEKVQVGLTSPYLKTGRYENERFVKKSLKKDISGQDASRNQKKVQDVQKI